MASELIAIGAGAANSSDITVADGAAVTVGLKQTDETVVGLCEIEVSIKDDGGAYRKIGTLRNNPVERAHVLTGPGVYRLSRTATSNSCGAFSA